MNTARIHWNIKHARIAFGSTYCFAWGAAAIATALALVGCGQSQATIQLPPTEVLVTTPVQQDIPVHNEWVATLGGWEI